MTKNSTQHQFDTINDCVNFLRSRQTSYKYVIFNLSYIANNNLRTGYKEILVSLLTDLARSFNGVLFTTDKCITVLAIQNATDNILERRLEVIDSIFSRDKDFLSAAYVPVFDRLYRVYDARDGFDVFLEDLINVQAPEQVPQEIRRFINKVEGEFNMGAMTIKQVARVEEFIPKVNLNNYLTVSPVYTLFPNEVPEKLMSYVSVNHDVLVSTLMPNTSLVRRENLRRSIFKVSHRRLLRLIINKSINLSNQSLAIPIGYDTIFSAEFLELSTSNILSSDQFFVVCIGLMDVIEDYKNFEYIKDFVRQKDQLIAINGITLDQLRYIQVELFDCDFLIFDMPDNYGDMPVEEFQAILTGFIGNLGPEKVVLACCDDADKIAIGQAAGGIMFMDRKMDSLMRSYTSIA